MSERVFWRHTLFRLPLKTAVYEINEVCLGLVFALHHGSQVLGVDVSDFALGVWLLQGSVVVVKKYFSSGCNDYHRSWWNAFDLHNTLHLFLFILSGKDWEANKELIKNATKRPHVNGWSVSDAHHDLRCSVESTLNVGVELLTLISATAIVNHFDATLVLFPKKNVLWLQVTVHNLEFFHKVE